MSVLRLAPLLLITALSSLAVTNGFFIPIFIRTYHDAPPTQAPVTPAPDNFRWSPWSMSHHQQPSGVQSQDQQQIITAADTLRWPSWSAQQPQTQVYRNSWFPFANLFTPQTPPQTPQRQNTNQENPAPVVVGQGYVY